MDTHVTVSLKGTKGAIFLSAPEVEYFGHICNARHTA